MPGKQRFGSGSLLGAVRPLPDDDEPEQPPAPEPEPEPVAVEPLAPEPEPEPEPPAAPAVAPTSSRRGRDVPPATLRLNEQASAALWEAFLVVKQADPFLSFRQFASAVVLDGLDRAARRARRS